MSAGPEAEASSKASTSDAQKKAAAIRRERQRVKALDEASNTQLRLENIGTLTNATARAWLLQMKRVDDSVTIGRENIEIRRGLIRDFFARSPKLAGVFVPLSTSGSPPSEVLASTTAGMSDDDGNIGSGGYS